LRCDATVPTPATATSSILGMVSPASLASTEPVARPGAPDGPIQFDDYQTKGSRRKGT
jgi:hypothetical protein